MRCARGGRRKRRQRGDDHEIPFDLIIEILTRLPVTSLMRFKCVSKLWSCLTLSRYFSNLYLMVASSPPIRLYMSLVEHYECDSMELCHSPGMSVIINIIIIV
uniref:F-box domain-containing protein n=1 Tax=Brassica oleracea TaxID=3712 RepID=A0A3P6DM85_BRAOL|nr:unnamed protein product [Brassica oleracea]